MIGLRKPRALLLTEFPSLCWGTNSGAILDSSDYDCNMKMGPARAALDLIDQSRDPHLWEMKNSLLSGLRICI
jgi:hypothetical protein